MAAVSVAMGFGFTGVAGREPYVGQGTVTKVEGGRRSSGVAGASIARAARKGGGLQSLSSGLAGTGGGSGGLEARESCDDGPDIGLEGKRKCA